MTTTQQPAAATAPAPQPRRLRLAVLAAAGVLVAVASTGWTAFGFLSVFARQQATASASYNGVRKVTIDAGPADVTITTTAADAVQLDRTLQWSFGHPVVSATRNGDHLTIRAWCPLNLVWSCSVHLRLRVPGTTSISGLGRGPRSGAAPPAPAGSRAHQA